MLDLIKKTMLTGIGLALLAKDEIEDLAKELTEKGKMTEKEGKQFLGDLQTRYEEVQRKLEQRVEKTVKEIEKNSFIELKTFENIQREMVVSNHGTRPSFDMLGHTGYLTFARKVL